MSFIKKHNESKRDYILTHCLFILAVIATCMFTRLNITEVHADWATYDQLTDTGKAQANWGATVHVIGNGATKADFHWKYYIDSAGRGHLNDGLPPAGLTVTENHGKYYSNGGGSQTGWWFESTGYGFSFKCDTVGLTPVVQLDVPEREGYRFKGWTVSGAMGQWDYIYLKYIEVGYNPWGNDITCTANWEPIATPVTLNMNGGNINGATTQDLLYAGVRPTYGQSYFNGVGTPTRTGYDFAGYYTQQSSGFPVWDTNGYAIQWQRNTSFWGGGSTWSDGWMGGSYTDWGNMRWTNTSTDRLTFYAHWNPHHYFMVSNVNTPAEAHTVATGGWGSVITTYDDTNYGTAYTASCPGYTFLGWFTAGGEMIYNAQGQRCTNNSVFDNRGAWRWAGGNWATLNLYAHWSNNPPANEWFKATELGTNNVWWANINNNNPANQGAITDTTKWSNKGYNFRLRGNDIGDGIRFAGILNENDCWFTSWNGNVTVGEWTADITNDGIYSQVYGHVKDSAGQWRNTGAFKVYIDKQAPKINTFNVNIGAQKNLMPNADMSVIGSHPAVGNVYKDYDSTPYGSWVNVRISDANNSISAIRGGSGAVSGINTVQVKVYDIKNPSHNKVYTLTQNPGINYEYSGILDTISDFPEVMELGYELTVTDYAGNTRTSDTKSTSRGIEVYSSIEKVDTDINGDSSFVCGTRGIVHVFTTGWVDNVSVQFPDSFNKAWAYDEARGVPKPSLTPINYHTYGRNDFIRCWDIEFWIPMSLINPDNPDHITPDPNGSINWPINVIGHDEYPYINVNLPGGTLGHGGSTPDATINVPTIPGNNKSILDQFRTIIKQDN